jgi:NTE family protein
VTRVVAVLSGGGAKAAAHLGALKALAERGLTPEHYVATSMGAVVAACLAAGLSYEQTILRMTRIKRSDVAQPSAKALLGYFSSSFLRAAPLRKTIARLVPATEFDDLEIPLTVTAVDPVNGQLVLFGAGGREHVPLADALYASCALPVYYPAAQIAGRSYVDGGLRAVLPIDVAAQFDPDLIFAVSVGPSFYDEPAEQPGPVPPLVRSHGSVLRVMMAAQTEETLSRWQAHTRDGGAKPGLVVVRPVMEAEATFATQNVVHYVEEGYRAGMVALALSRVLPQVA